MWIQALHVVAQRDNHFLDISNAASIYFTTGISAIENKRISKMSRIDKGFRDTYKMGIICS